MGVQAASVDEPLRLACQSVIATWIATATAMFRQDGKSSKAAEELAATVVAALGGAFTLARTA